MITKNIAYNWRINIEKERFIMTKTINMQELKSELNAVLEKYGYEVRNYALDERHGRTTHRKPTIELTLEEIKEEPRSFWID